MQKDILSEVIEAEKEIQQRLEVEKAKSRDWLENVKKESEEKLVREEKNIKESLNKSIEVAKKEAELKATEIVNQTEARAERLAKVNDQTLVDVVGKQIARILPG
jgi:vacuolar-type H+-ATPase subunit H